MYVFLFINNRQVTHTCMHFFNKRQVPNTYIIVLKPKTSNKFMHVDQQKTSNTYLHVFFIYTM